MSVYGDPPDPIEDPRDDSERWEEAFKVMEDERAEFEATFRDLGFSLIRAPAHPQGVACSAHCDYLSYPTGCAWRGWLEHAGVQWVASK